MNIRFIEEGPNAGKYECEDCAFTGEAELEEDEMEEGDIDFDEEDKALELESDSLDVV